MQHAIITQAKPAIARLVRNLLTPAFVAFGWNVTEQQTGEIGAATATLIVLGVQLWWSCRDDAKRETRAAELGVRTAVELDTIAVRRTNTNGTPAPTVATDGPAAAG